MEEGNGGVLQSFIATLDCILQISLFLLWSNYEGCVPKRRHAPQPAEGAGGHPARIERGMKVRYLEGLLGP